MVKKGKEKASAPPPQASSASSKKPSKPNNKKTPQEDDFIVFTNSTSDSKPKKGGQGSSKGKGKADENEELPPGPPKPTVKQIIGGSSWTGKLPVNLLSEHCQRQKWDRPDYQLMKSSEGVSYFVVLSAKNPKTQEVTKLPPFKLAPEHKHLVTRETPLEAKHAAATYALFRVCSMKNIHTTLPPDHRALWKQFEAIKVEDVRKQNGWMYDADPFATLKQREDAKAAAEKKRKERETVEAKAKTMPGAAGLVLRSNAASSAGGGGNPMKGWTTVPKIEMGRKTRSQLEDLVRREVIWNPHGVQMPPSLKATIVRELTGSGFRQSHVEEAVDGCKDREEALEWLLVHVPEDDLPRWALPESYSAGVSVAAISDLKREAAIKRLSQSGYSAELCKKLYEEHSQDEGRTAEALQNFLLSSGNDTTQPKSTGEEPLIFGTPEECWSDEMESLSSVFGDHFKQVSEDVCQIRIESVKNGPKRDIETFAQFRRSSRHPSEVILCIVSDLPSYIKLSVIKKTLGHLAESLSDEPMKIYFAVDWIQQNINSIIEKPGKLREISGVASAVAEVRKTHSAKLRQSRHPKPLPQGTDVRSREEWQKRQESSAMKEMIAQRQKLPAWQVRDQVVKTVLQYQVTIIAGETGSGKSTQSVQFILDDLYRKGLGNATSIICTQPRRISALGLADRVSEERCSQVGKEVGYTIRGENKTSANTKITFVTTGVLLRRLQTSGGRTKDVLASLADVSHVVIDEVHERSLDTDFLLSIIRDVLKQRKDLKLILMSATLDAAAFKSYFTTEGLGVGLVEISGRTFPVEDYYLEDIIRMTDFTIDNDRYRDPDEALVGDSTANPNPINKIIQKLGSRINYSLVVEITKAIDAELYARGQKGGILIFLPGVAEITRTVNQLKAVSSLHVLPLHASLDTREQRRVFTSPPPGKRKVVVATNVAETSITIDDIVAVIDSGRVKETSFDPQNNMRKLEDTWASRAACKQRRGRAGRVQAGKCYKLYTESLEERMAERPEPEIRRVPLEQLCLSVRAMGTRDIGGFLGRTPTPPTVMAVENAIRMLQRMGALDGEELTALGQQLAMIPADLRCGKLMVYGAIFGCLDESITIAAILSTKSPFFAPPEKRDQAREARMRFNQGDGDLLTDLRAYQQWSTMLDQGTPQRQVRNFCDDNFLSYQTLSDISSTRTQYYAALAEIGLVDTAATGKPLQDVTVSMPLLRALTASAFAPQIARIQFPDKKFASSMSGAVELDPEARTIKYFTQENGRVFIHPSSALFDSQGFAGNAAFLSYFTMISTSKVFIRDLTPFNAFTLLLFSGAIELDTLGRGLVVDGWLRLRGWARLGVLVSRLRGMVDNIIAMKVNNPHMDVQDNEVVKIVTKLIELDGLDA